MLKVKGNYPFPVLGKGRNDYIPSCKFFIKMMEERNRINGNQIYLYVSYELVSNSIQRLLDEKKAKAVVFIRCQDTSFTRAYPFEDSLHEQYVEINKFDVIGQIEISGAIVAVENINGFSGDDELNSIYFDNLIFKYAKGNYLAIDSGFVQPVNSEELDKPIRSIFMISHDPAGNNKNNLVPDFNDDLITILVSRETYELYCAYKDNHDPRIQKMLSSVLVLPVLSDVVHRINENNPDNGEDVEKGWYKSIQYKAEKKHISLSDHMESSTLANLLLDDIVTDAMKGIDAIMSSGLDMDDLD